MKNEKSIEVAILAGGRGQRMMELTKDKPKSLLEFKGKPILTHILDNIIEAFGSARVILATGYKGEQIEKMFGGKYRDIDISYVHDPRPLEIKKRLLSVKDKISCSFLFLATDVICDANELLKVAELQEKENKIMFGTISGATDHQPALTHAIIKTNNDLAVDLEFPPSANWQPDDLRDIHVACFQPDFIGLLETSPENFNSISQVIAKAIKEGRDFQISKYCNPWYHFADPKDLEKQIRQNPYNSTGEADV
jgi:NDP-sugar pyrophosphorylase family protein